MTDKKPIGEGYQPQKGQFGYQPSKVERGYQPQSSKSIDTSNPPSGGSDVHLQSTVPNTASSGQTNQTSSGDGK